MASGSAIDYRSLTRESTTVFSQTMGLVALTTATFALGAYAARDVSSGWVGASFIAALLTVFGVSAASRRSERLALGLLLGFGALIGVAVAPTITDYASSNPQALSEAGAATALFIVGFGSAGYATRRDLSHVGRVLIGVLLGLIVFGFIAVLTQVPHGSVIYVVLGLVIFAGLTAYDFQRLRRANDIRTAPLVPLVRRPTRTLRSVDSSAGPVIAAPDDLAPSPRPQAA
jgi:FtsH-binding integral membrane protein